MRQATFLGMPTSPEELLRVSTNAKPSRSTKGDRLARILALLDGTRTIDQVIQEMTTEAQRPRDLIAQEVRGAVERYGR